jgi:hypothetical protein
LHSNGSSANHIENIVLLLLRACSGRYPATASFYRITA